MPELPEVETIRRGLQKRIVGRRIVGLEILSAKSFDSRGHEATKYLLGQRIRSVERRAKWLQIHLNNGFSLLIHLRMTGQLVVRGKHNFGGGHPTDSLVGVLPDRSTRVILTLDNAAKLYFNDQRKFGLMLLLPTKRIDRDTMIGEIGPEPLDPSLSATRFVTLLRRRDRSIIKAVLLDQRVIAGLGNIYVDEALYAARIHPLAKPYQLSDRRLRELLVAIRRVLNEALDRGGSTDKTYVQVDGRRGGYLSYAAVFRRQNQACRRCGQPIRKIRVAGRGTHYCSKCQRPPRPLKRLML